MGYLFYADVFGWIPMGNDGELVVPKCVRSRRALLELAKNWLGKRAGRIYYMTSWTQPMSELSPSRFEEYIASHGELLCRSHYGEE